MVSSAAVEICSDYNQHFKDSIMHNQQLMKDTHREVSRYYALSLTPLSLVGLPRMISGKTLDQWKCIPVIYGLAAAYYFLAKWVNYYSESLSQGILWGAIVTFTIACICHMGLIFLDFKLFKSIKKRLEIYIEQ
jgi:hypothetical protein